MKKIISLGLSILLTICLASTVYATSSCKVSLKTSKTNLIKGEEVSVNVVLSNIQDKKGIIGLSAVLEYDEDSLEYVEIEEQEGWEKASYNKKNGIIAILREETYATSNQTVFKIIFKARVKNKEKTEIILKDVRTSNGDKDIKLGDLKSIVTIKTNNDTNDTDNDNSGNNNENNSKPDNNKPNDNNITNNDNNKNESNNVNNSKDDNNSSNNDLNDDIKNGKLPQTGNTENTILIVVLGIVLFVIIGIILYIKIRKINKIEKR